MRYVRRFDGLGRGDIATAGGKGANLGELTRAGLPVPPGFVLTTAAYRAFVAVGRIGDEVLALADMPRDAEPGAYEEPSARIRALFAAPVPDDVAAELRAVRAVLGPAVAVRSSATAEDLEGASFAGQQDTFLDVRGDDALLAAVRDCWASLWTARAMAYRRRRGIDPADVALAVVVQEMVDADAAGVLFTANPTTGRRDEAVVAAAWGLGEAVVGGAVTTDDLVVDKATGHVVSRATADKAVMTVATGHGTQDRPVPAERRNRAVLDDAEAATLVALGARIEHWFGAPQDIEWARAGGEFRIVQSRPITALPEPAASPPTDWPVPDPTALYVRASIIEQLPDPLSTLFAELIDGAVTRSLQAMFGELMGRAEPVRPEDVGLPTVNGYAYYRYSRAGMLRVLRQTPRALRLLARRGRDSVEVRWREEEHPRYAQLVARWTGRPLDGLSMADLLGGVEELLDAGARYYTAVQTIIPLAASSEVVFTRFYERLVRRAGDPPAATFLLGFDSAPIRAEQSLYDLAAWTHTHRNDRVARRHRTGANRGAARRGRTGRGRPRDLAGVVRPLPGPSRRARPHRLQPRRRSPRPGGRPGAADRDAAVLPRGRRDGSETAAGPRRGPSGGGDGCRARTAGPGAPCGVHPSRPPRAGSGAGARRRPRRRRARLAAAAPHAA
jgi:pyruvate,water dikinase